MDSKWTRSKCHKADFVHVNFNPGEENEIKVNSSDVEHSGSTIPENAEVQCKNSVKETPKEVKTIYIIKTNINLDDDSIRQLLIDEDLLEPDNDFCIKKETQSNMLCHEQKERLYVAIDNTNDQVTSRGCHGNENCLPDDNSGNQGTQPGDTGEANETVEEKEDSPKEDKKDDQLNAETEDTEDGGKLVIVTRGK